MRMIAQSLCVDRWFLALMSAALVGATYVAAWDMGVPIHTPHLLGVASGLLAGFWAMLWMFAAAAHALRAHPVLCARMATLRPLFWIPLVGVLFAWQIGWSVWTHNHPAKLDAVPLMFVGVIMLMLGAVVFGLFVVARQAHTFRPPQDPSQD